MKEGFHTTIEISCLPKARYIHLISSQIMQKFPFYVYGSQLSPPAYHKGKGSHTTIDISILLKLTFAKFDFDCLVISRTVQKIVLQLYEPH